MADPIRVYFSVSQGKGHNAWWEYTEAPPEGVHYVFPQPGQTGYIPDRNAKPTLVERLRASPALMRAYTPLLMHVLGGVGVKDRLDRLGGKDPGYDVYHSMGGVHPLPEPWVTGLESTVDFFTFGRGWRTEMESPASRRYVAKKLLSKHCVRMLPWSEAARRSILTTFPEHAKELDRKIEIVPLALRAGPEPPAERSDATIRLLFVGSRNYPADFLPKGGHLVLAAYERLKKKYDVELVVRAKVPDKYLARYERTPGLTILDGEMSFDELNRLYTDAHIFMFPGSSTPGMVIREAMRAARPTVTIDVWANGELVQDGVTGMVAPPPEGVAYTTNRGALNWSHDPSFLDPFETNIEKSVAGLVEKTGRLIEDSELRRRLGANARKEIVDGRYSIARRNRDLRRIYEEAVALKR